MRRQNKNDFCWYASSLLGMQSFEKSPAELRKIPAGIILENSKQVADERAMRVPVAPFMDFSIDNMLAVAQFQLPFLSLVAKPFWAQMIKIFPRMEERVRQLDGGVELWALIRDELVAEEA